MFELSEFIDLYNALKTKKEVLDSLLSDITKVNPTIYRYKDISPSYYTSADTPRKFFYGHFKYKNKYISFLELEHSKNLESIATWFFISENGLLNEEFFHLFLHRYLNVYKNLEKVKSKLLSKNSIKFFSKPHPSYKIDDEKEQQKKEIDKWANGVIQNLERI